MSNRSDAATHRAELHARFVKAIEDALVIAEQRHEERERKGIVLTDAISGTEEGGETLEFTGIVMDLFGQGGLTHTQARAAEGIFREARRKWKSGR